MSTSRPPSAAQADAPRSQVELLTELNRAFDADLSQPGPCQALVALAQQVPGRVRRISQVLGEAGSGPAFAALRQLPADTKGLVTCLAACLHNGAIPPGTPPPAVLAIDFTHSRAHAFPDWLLRAGDLARRATSASLTYTAARPNSYTLAYDRNAARDVLQTDLRAAQTDLLWLYDHLVKLRGTRLWLQGWCFTADDPLGPAARATLLREFIAPHIGAPRP